MPVSILLIPTISTVTGGLLAARYRQYLYILIAIGAGLLLGAAFLDLMPEAISLGTRFDIPVPSVLGWVLLSFLLFHALESGLRSFEQRWKDRFTTDHLFRLTGAAMLVFHSFRDGVAIGAAFSASHAAGYAVTCGIAAHDLGDGMNMVILTTRGNKPAWTDYALLAVDSIAPFAGGLTTAWWALSTRGSVFVLALASGFFLQMATGDFLPAIRRCNIPQRVLVSGILAGVSIIYLANMLLARFAH